MPFVTENWTREATLPRQDGEQGVTIESDGNQAPVLSGVFGNKLTAEVTS
ncbi:MAG: hypothetical protein KatS3mg074_484 [Meiothermus sp.]|uniref:Uncharacterized protein n=1 Tax=Meiothermus hypogaeus TaxID=884155 RepID=A0ABX9MPA2_9DEIN|nr:hypothetical protein [Meiothermus hypogaeus]RIH79471.1 hypothetical protein Mhypo_01113 [Meiothermus hypogaeus]GIW38086.1 MAG: hypothetical protein KatS3mg074_484 [Meiothermus sp.]